MYLLSSQFRNKFYQYLLEDLSLHSLEIKRLQKKINSDDAYQSRLAQKKLNQILDDILRLRLES